MFDKAEAILDQAQASACRLEASAQNARATVTNIEAIKTRLDAKVTNFQRMGKHHRLVLHAGKCDSSNGCEGNGLAREHLLILCHVDACIAHLIC